MNPKLSVIIPVYNTLPYLHACFDSVKSQKYKPMEVIIIDDGSTDGSDDFCDEYAKSDDRFCVVHQKNGGLSSARNLGIEKASGEYITFVDSDDTLIGQPYSILIDILTENSGQIIGMDYFYSDDGLYGVAQKNNHINFEIMDNNQFYAELCNQTISEAVWNKIFSKSLFVENQFTEGVLNEDFLLLIQMAKCPLKIIKTDYLGYYYCKRFGGITGQGFKKNMIDAVYNANYAYINAPNKQCKWSAKGYFLHKILMFMINMPNSFVKNKNKDYLYAREKLRGTSIIRSNRSVRDKVLLELFKFAPSITNKICAMYVSRGRKG